ncbi:MAG: hypothetical protein ACPHQC_02145 [Poseidonia sp.]
MTRQPVRAITCVALLLLMSASPLLSTASAHSSILLSVDTNHVVMSPGESANITLSIENNASSIESYNITVDDSSLSVYWEIIATDAEVSNVFPTWSKNTTIIVRLNEGATVSDSGEFTITATEPDANVSTSLTVYVTVAPAYHPSLHPTGNGLTQMLAGGSTNLTFDASNLGTVTDTFLLDVEVQPDLAAWWANHSNSTTGNNSGGNSSDNGTGDNTSSNGTASNLSLLMYGNSYTSANNLASLVESVIDASGYNGTVSSLTGGGLVLDDHWQNLNTSGNQWNTTLRNDAWDFVILQDQSQVPSLPTNDSVWQESKNASVSLSNEIEAEGSETVLFMTWGRRSGESGTQWHQYNNINQNFTDMQERLAEGYTRYAENISTAGNTVWIAPVGLAFKTVHDSVVAAGNDPTASGNLFYDLYTSDGSHPSLAGSYLSACVMHSTTTGETCVGSNDTVALSANVKLALQEAADDTVFNQTAGMSYYPWEVSGTSAFGMGSSIPNGWYLQWEDDELSQMPAGGSEIATLSVTVPADADPDFYGYRLTMGSTNGNITTSTIIVIEVVAEPALSLAFLQQADAFLPGGSTVSAVQVTNTGNTNMDVNWDVTTSPATGSMCTASLVTAETQGLLPDAVTNVSFMVDVHESADSSDQCSLTLTATVHDNGVSSVLEELNFIVEIDEAVNFSLAGPINTVDIVPSEGKNYEIRLSNHGSDQALFFLDVNESLGLDTVLVTASGVSIGPGDVGTWTVHTEGDASLSGLLTQTFSVTYGGHTEVLDVEVNLLEVASFTVSGGSEDRLLIQPGQSETMEVNVTNTGTSNLSLSVSLLNLPADVSVMISETTISLGHGESRVLNITFTAQTGAVASTTEIELHVAQQDRSESLLLDLIVVDREDVLVTSLQSHLFAHPLTTETMSVEVINLGTATEVFVVDWSTVSSSSWFEFTRTYSSLTLAAGASQTVELSVIETSPGAPAEGVVYTFSVTSSTNPSNTDSLDVTVQPATAGANITALVENGEARPGQTVSGTVTVTNTGNVEDTLSISTVGADCGLDANITLGAGLSSSPLGWSCTLPSDAPAGQQAITFRAVSSMRSNVAEEYSVLYTVEADWPANTLVALSFDEATISLGVDSSTTTVLTVQNLGNTEVTGTLDAVGKDMGLVLLEWMRLSDQEATADYTLTAGSSIDFKLTIISNTARTGSADLTVRATSSAAGVITSDESVPLQINIEGPALPPNGLALPLGVSVSQPVTLGVMGFGWLAALVLLQLRRRSSTKKDHVDLTEPSEEEEEDEEEEEELGYNECRLDGDNKVNCPTCEARLGVPRGSEPPFRFTCPKCSNKIRVVE